MLAFACKLQFEWQRYRYYYFIFAIINIIQFVIVPAVFAFDKVLWIKKYSSVGEQVWLVDDAASYPFPEGSVVGQKLIINQGMLILSGEDIIMYDLNGRFHCNSRKLGNISNFIFIGEEEPLYSVTEQGIYSLNNRCNDSSLYEYPWSVIWGAVYNGNTSFTLSNDNNEIMLAENNQIVNIPLSNGFEVSTIGGNIDEQLLVNGYYRYGSMGRDEKRAIIILENNGYIKKEIKNAYFVAIAQNGDFHTVSYGNNETVCITKWSKGAEIICTIEQHIGDFSYRLAPIDEYAPPVVIDDSGNMYYYDRETRIYKYNDQCELLWSSNIISPNYRLGLSNIEHTGCSLVLFGSQRDFTKETSENYRVDLAVYDLNGKQKWNEDDFVIEDAMDTIIYDVVADEDGNIYSAGYYYIMDDEEDGTVGGCGC